MEDDMKAARRRLRTLELARKLGNVSEACRQQGMTRTQFYEYKKRYTDFGLEGLVDRPPVVKSHPQTTHMAMVERICDLGLAHPSRGCNYLGQILEREGVRVSGVTIQKILNAHELGTRLDRRLALERQYAEMRADITPEQITFLEEQNPAFHERRLESSKPAELICQGIWSIGNVKSAGRLYMHAVVDTYNGYAFGTLQPSNGHGGADGAAAVLENQVLPFYHEHGLRTVLVHTDGRPEFHGWAARPYEICLALNHIRHRMARGSGLPANGFLERFRQVVNREFFTTRLHPRRPANIDALQGELDAWLHGYNHEQPYLGYRNQGQTPYGRLQEYLANQAAVDGATTSPVNVSTQDAEVKPGPHGRL